VYRQKQKVVSKFFSLGVKLESTGEWKGQKENIKMKGMQILGATDTC